MTFGSVITALKCCLKPSHLRPLIIGACGLGLWQVSQTLLGFLPQPARPAVLLANILSGMAGFLTLALLPGILLRRAAAEPGSPIDWRVLSDLPGRVLTPALVTVLILLWSFLPLEMYLALLGKGRPSPWVLGLTLGMGLSYFPMALLMAATSGKLMPSLLPSGVLERICGQWAGYLKLLALFWPMVLLPLAGLLLWPLPLAGPLLSSFILLWLWCGAAGLLAEFRARVRWNCPEECQS
jgi:hypothetical protein